MTPLEAFDEIRRIVDKTNSLSVHDVIKLVEEKFTSCDTIECPDCGAEFSVDCECPICKGHWLRRKQHQ